jgi:hypothetical protein
MAGCNKYDKKYLGFIECRKFLDRLSGYRLFYLSGTGLMIVELFLGFGTDSFRFCCAFSVRPPLSSTEFVDGRVQAETLLKMAAFSDVVPSSLVQVYRRFRGACCLHHQISL